MQIQVNTDHNTPGRETFLTEVTGEVEHGLNHFRNHITRVEVHVTDENSDKKSGGDDMRCLMEARLEGHQPLVVKHRAATRQLAVKGAIDHLSRLIKDTIEKLREKNRHRTDPYPPPL